MVVLQQDYLKQEKSCYTRSTVEGRRSSIRSGVYSFVGGGPGLPMPESHKMTSDGILMCIFLTKLSETESMRMATGPDFLYSGLLPQPSIMHFSSHSLEKYLSRPSLTPCH